MTAASDNIAMLVMHYAVLPRLTIALLAGAGLAVAGALFQHALDNPLAAPTTLGVTAGAELALVVATLAAPNFLVHGQSFIAVAGAGLGAAAILTLASTGQFSGAGVIVAGLAIGLFCHAAASALQLANQEDLGAVLLWDAGSLDQTGWSKVRGLWPVLACGAALLAALARPIGMLGLDDASTRGLGVDPGLVRAVALALGAALAGTITAAVGPIAFVELAAPRLALSLGARRLGVLLPASALVGAGLLFTVDETVHLLAAYFEATIPTGAVTALMAAPLVFWLLPRVAMGAAPVASGLVARRVLQPQRVWAGLGLALAILTAAALLIGRDGLGWAWIGTADWAALLPWRWPRTLGALASGAMLAEAGTLIQRTTGNPLAGPEVLGVGAAATAGAFAVLVVVPGASHGLLVCGGALAAMGQMALLLWRGARTGFRADQMILAGLVLGGALSAVTTLALALGDPRGPVLMAWLAGSTSAIDPSTACRLALAALLAVPLALLFHRVLDILPLGGSLPAALGVSTWLTRLGTTALAALLTAMAVLVAGPSAFVGLVGPHLARQLGLRRAASELIGAALIGGLTMVSADWVGRTVTAPFEIPAGLVASLLGAPVLLLLTGRRRVGATR